MRAAVGTTIAQMGRLGQAVTDVERQKAEALRETARLDKTGRQIGAYRQLGTQVLEAGRAHRDAQDKVRMLAREIAAAEAPTKAQTKALEAARREVVRAAAAEEAKKQRLVALRAELNAVGIDTRRLADAQRRLAADTAEVRGRIDQTTQAITRMGAALEQADKRKALMGDLARETLKVGAAYMAMRKPINQEGDFELHLAMFGNAADMTAGQLEQVRRQMRSLSTEVLQSSDALLIGVEVLVGKGMEAPQALAAIKDIGRAATATGASMQDMADLSYSVMSNLHVPVDKLGKALDIMAQAGKEGGFELKNMAREFPQLTAAAAALGLTGTEAVASLGAALQVAMKGASDPSTAANNLANFLQKIAAPDAKKNFEKLGIDIAQELADGVAAGKNPIEIAMEQIAEATGADLNQTMADAFDENGKMVAGAAEKIAGRFKLGEIFGDKQAQDFIVPMLAGYQDYLKIKQKAAGAGGVVDQDFARVAATYNKAAAKMGLATDKLMGSIGKAVLPVITPIISRVADGVDVLANLADASPRVTAALAGVVGALVLYRGAATVARLGMTLYRSGLIGLMGQSLGAARASTAAAAGVTRVGAASAGLGGRMGAAVAGLRQYTAAAGSAAAASGRLAAAQGGIGGAGMLGGMGRALRTGGKALGGAGLAIGGVMAAADLMDPNLSKADKAGSAGNLAGGLAGAAAGAAIGSVVPIIGTTIGMVIGGALGAWGGDVLGRKLFEGDGADKGGKAEGASSAAEAPPHDVGGAGQDQGGESRIVNVTFAPGSIVVQGAPGMDVRALADQVAQLIMQRQRAALAD